MARNSGEVPMDIQQQILHSLGLSVGSLPFRYLGVPLSAKKLSVAQCQPLLNKMLAKVNHWIAKFLSYAERLQLIKSVMIVIQSFWSQIFPLPKTIILKIETIIFSYVHEKMKATGRHWWPRNNYICWPKSAGGMNFTNILVWNRAVILKHLWNLCKKKDRLWIQWMHSYKAQEGTSGKGSSVDKEMVLKVFLGED